MIERDEKGLLDVAAAWLVAGILLLTLIVVSDFSGGEIAPGERFSWADHAPFEIPSAIL